MTLPNTQHWNPAQYAENARFVSDLGMPVVELLLPQPGEHILDLGCGDGALTLKLVAFGCNVVGVDASADMIAAAKALGLNAHVMDGESLRFNQEFDAVFSNAVLHWMKNPQIVVAGVWRALKAGGRFVGEFGGHGNVSAITNVIESALAVRGVAFIRPWYFPRPEAYKALLEATGFQVENITHFSRPTPLPGNVSAWLKTFAQPYTAALPAAERDDFISGVTEVLRPTLCDANGIWTADYVRIRFAATKPNTAT